MPKGIYKHKPFSIEHREKIRQSKLNKPVRFWLGKHRSLETREKIGKANKGNIKSKELRKQMSIARKGRHFSKEEREKKYKSRRGLNHPCWKGGVTPINEKIRRSPEYKLWRDSVFKRDGFTCIWCGKKNGNGKTVILNADHIKPFSLYPELRFAIDNGRTLCRECHMKTDTFGTKLNKIIKL